MGNVSLFLSDLEERKRNRRRRIRKMMFVGIILVVAGVAWWGVSRSPWTRVDTMTISGTRRVEEGRIMGLVEEAASKTLTAKIFGTTRHMWAMPAELEASAIASIPNLLGVRIERDRRAHAVRVIVEERTPFGIWCFKKDRPIECVWIDRSGVGFEPAPQAEGNLIRVVGDYARSKSALGDEVIRPEFIEPLASIFDALAAANISMQEVRFLDPGLWEVTVATYDGPDLLFSLRLPADFSVPVITSLREKDRRGDLTPRFAELTYIDFRVPDRAYYK